MPKNIVFCADGTWNCPEGNGVNECVTNVYKIYKSFALTCDQVPLYDDGLRPDGSRFEKLENHSFGAALFDRIRQAYGVIAHLYERGDRIFLFGFSRGAYIARSVAAMIAISGLPTGDPDEFCLETAFRAYREKDARVSLLARLNSSYDMDDAKISMLGVWETVGTLGIPQMFGVNEILYGFHDTHLHEDVLAAYQALALDERRVEFTPTLWTNPPCLGQIIEQVWFAGVHGDIGGGYRHCGLSNISLSWMLWRARQHGLKIVDSALAMYGSPCNARQALGHIHESWDKRWQTPRSRSIPDNAVISNSVDVRLARDHGYRPINLHLNGRGNLNGYQSATVVIGDQTLLYEPSAPRHYVWD